MPIVESLQNTENQQQLHPLHNHCHHLGVFFEVFKNAYILSPMVGMILYIQDFVLFCFVLRDSIWWSFPHVIKYS